MKLYSNTAIDKLADRYIEKNGYIDVIDEGSLLTYGMAIFHGKKLKTTVVKEKYLNAWSSAYIMRKYNKMPKKYEKMIEEITYK